MLTGPSQSPNSLVPLSSWQYTMRIAVWGLALLLTCQDCNSSEMDQDWTREQKPLATVCTAHWQSPSIAGNNVAPFSENLERSKNILVGHVAVGDLINVLLADTNFDLNKILLIAISQWQSAASSLTILSPVTKWSFLLFHTQNRIMTRLVKAFQPIFWYDSERRQLQRNPSNKVHVFGQTVSCMAAALCRDIEWLFFG